VKLCKAIRRIKRSDGETTKQDRCFLLCYSADMREGCYVDDQD
jgi:hypothetical protein